ncbi:MAG: glutamate 5-kinase [Desulfobacterales bacterium]|nr:glutamate 5-kinase [Desulfobacterales bacterium]
MSNKDIRKKTFQKARRIVVKVGSSILASIERGLHHEVFSQLAKEISELKRQGYEIVLVSSGAIAAGMEKLGYKTRPQSVTQKQATAAVGQSRLMNIYESCFSRHQQMVAQILLTHDDLSHRRRFLNARNTLLTLLELGIIPIINENDTVVVDEIKVGDNDNLSALVTNLIEADLLIILTNIDGLCDGDPRLNPNARCIPLVEDIDVDMGKIVGGTKSAMSVGGMVSKIQAAKKASRFGIPTAIASGTRKEVLHQILRGKEIGTLILPKATTLSSRKHWIAFNLNPKGDIILDDGAKKAIVQRGKSLLPSGVVKVRGEFDRGDSVSCLGPRGKEFARGLVNYSASELERIKGLKTEQIEKVLGYKYSDEVIHRDDLVVL